MSFIFNNRHNVYTLGKVQNYLPRQMLLFLCSRMQKKPLTQTHKNISAAARQVTIVIAVTITAKTVKISL